LSAHTHNTQHTTQRHSKLSDAMVAAEKERKRNEEEKRQREMAEELARQARAKKVAKLQEVLGKPKELVRDKRDDVLTGLSPCLPACLLAGWGVIDRFGWNGVTD
jgi:protein subunit release factor B